MASQVFARSARTSLSRSSLVPVVEGGSRPLGIWSLDSVFASLERLSGVGYFGIFQSWSPVDVSRLAE